MILRTGNKLGSLVRSGKISWGIDYTALGAVARRAVPGAVRPTTLAKFGHWAGRLRLNQGLNYSGGTTKSPPPTQPICWGNNDHSNFWNSSVFFVGNGSFKVLNGGYAAYFLVSVTLHSGTESARFDGNHCCKLQSHRFRVSHWFPVWNYQCHLHRHFIISFLAKCWRCIRKILNDILKREFQLNLWF